MKRYQVLLAVLMLLVSALPADTVIPVHRETVPGSTDIDVTLVHLDASGNTVEGIVVHIPSPLTVGKVQAACNAYAFAITSTAAAKSSADATLQGLAIKTNF